jgi:hypothetical protein
LLKTEKAIVMVHAIIFPAALRGLMPDFPPTTELFAFIVYMCYRQGSGGNVMQTYQK